MKAPCIIATSLGKGESQNNLAPTNKFFSFKVSLRFEEQRKTRNRLFWCQTEKKTILQSGNFPKFFLFLTFSLLFLSLRGGLFFTTTSTSLTLQPPNLKYSKPVNLLDLANALLEIGLIRGDKPIHTIGFHCFSNLYGGFGIPS